MKKSILISAFIPGSMHCLRDYYARNLRQNLDGSIKLVFHDHYGTGRLKHYLLRLSELFHRYDMVVSDYSSRVFTRTKCGVYMSHGYGTKLEPGLNELEDDAKMLSLHMMRRQVRHLVTLGEYNSNFYWRYTGEPAGLPYPQVHPLGLPRNDVLYNKDYIYQCRQQIDDAYGTHGKFTILFAPSWRGYDVEPPFTQQDFQQLDEAMGAQGSCMFYRPHYLEDLYSHIDYSGFDNIYDAAFSKQSSAATLMAASDMVLTDYSTIYIDYLALDRPIAFSLFDWDRFSEYRGVPYEKGDTNYLPGPDLAKLPDLADYIDSVRNGNDEYTEQRRQAYDYQVKYHDGNSSARVWALMLDVLGLEWPDNTGNGGKP